MQAVQEQQRRSAVCARLDYDVQGLDDDVQGLDYDVQGLDYEFVATLQHLNGPLQSSCTSELIYIRAKKTKIETKIAQALCALPTVLSRITAEYLTSNAMTYSHLLAQQMSPASKKTKYLLF